MEYLAPGITAALIVLAFECLIRFFLYKKHNFQEAIRIQIALNQMLGISLQMRNFYDVRRNNFLQFYSRIQLNNLERIWANFRHVDLAEWKNTFDVICFDWDLTQFLTGRESCGRHVLTHIIPIKLGFQSLLNVVEQRNKLLDDIHPVINAVANDHGEIFIYQNNNLEQIIGQSNNIKLRDITNHYIQTLAAVIVDCDKAFKVMTSYINAHFCCYEPLTLKIAPNLDNVFKQVINEEKNKVN
jgi:hypothetical protein